MSLDINPQDYPQESRARLELANPATGLPPVTVPYGDHIAWQLILLGIVCGVDKAAMVQWLTRLDGFPMWPPHDQLATLMWAAGYE